MSADAAVEPIAEHVRRTHIPLAIFYMVASGAVFSASNAASKWLIATYPIEEGGHAHSVGRALDRDRAVDESGNQVGVFGRIGARPFSLAEQRQLYIRNNQVWRVSDDPADPMYRKLSNR